MTVRDWLAAEPFELMLSAGFFGFFSHTGVLKALEEAKLCPKRVVGVSAGSLAGGLWCSGLEAGAVAEVLAGLQRRDFWDPGLPVGGFLQGKKFLAKLREVLAPSGVSQIEACKVPFAAVVHDVMRWRPVSLDSGPIDRAIAASCAVPFMFRPMWVDGRLVVDGGVSDRCGATGVFGANTKSDPPRVLLHYLCSRRRIGPKGGIPRRLKTASTLELHTPGLPRVTPFRLEQGPIAYQHTLLHVRQWLRTPIQAA